MAKKDTRDVGGEQLTDSQILERANAVLKTALFYTRDGHVLAAAAEILKLGDPVRAARCDRIARNLLGAAATPRESRKPTPWDDKIPPAEKEVEACVAEHERLKERWMLAEVVEAERLKAIRQKAHGHPAELPDDLYAERNAAKAATREAKADWLEYEKVVTKALSRLNDLRRARDRFRALRTA